ncbi:MAG: FGLLP motif-containing membrane protein [Candidatus Limnocylindrales bacterium]
MPAGPTQAPGTGGGGGGAGGGNPSGLDAFAASVARPGDLLRDPLLTLLALQVAILFLFLAAVPGVLFNKTLEEHYEEIAAGYHKFAGRFGGLGELSRDLAAFWHSSGGIVAFTVLSAIIYGFLMPGFGLSVASLAALLGLLGGLIVVMLFFDVPAREYHVIRTGDLGHLRVLPGSIIVAVVCVILSRVADFQPGYLYGLVVGFQFRDSLSDKDEGRSAALRSLWALGMSVVAWLALTVLSPTGSSNGSFVFLAMDTMLATIVVAGVEGALFELIPMRFLPGEQIFGWRRPVWAVLFVVSAFAFVAVLINPASGYLTNTRTVPLAVTVILFVAFAVFSVAFWAYFRYRPTPPPRIVQARRVMPDPAAPKPKRVRRRKTGGEGGI